jgi:hypothetical protein
MPVAARLIVTTLLVATLLPEQAGAQVQPLPATPISDAVAQIRVPPPIIPSTGQRMTRFPPKRRRSPQKALIGAVIGGGLGYWLAMPAQDLKAQTGAMLFLGSLGATFGYSIR